VGLQTIPLQTGPLRQQQCKRTSGCCRCCCQHHSHRLWGILCNSIQTWLPFSFPLQQQPWWLSQEAASHARAGPHCHMLLLLLQPHFPDKPDSNTNSRATCNCRDSSSHCCHSAASVLLRHTPAVQLLRKHTASSTTTAVAATVHVPTAKQL
jgi:hypothetical protein